MRSLTMCLIVCPSVWCAALVRRSCENVGNEWCRHGSPDHGIIKDDHATPAAPHKHHTCCLDRMTSWGYVAPDAMTLDTMDAARRSSGDGTGGGWPAMPSRRRRSVSTSFNSSYTGK